MNLNDLKALMSKSIINIMKTQILTFFGCRKAIPLIFLVSLSSSPIYAVSNDKHLFFSVSDLLQDTKQKPTIKLSGTVKDSFGALGGVIVAVGTTVVTTDLDGKYTTYITSGDKITFSMMGYKDQSMVYSGGSVLNITLSEDNNTLEEIVVNAGYYSVKDRERTGSIARVTAKDIEFQPVVNPLQAIQGRMAGVDITQITGVAGGGMNVEIRGRNFLDNSNKGRNNPMYIIDGVPFLSDALGKNDGNYSLQILQTNISPLNAINPDDIQSIEILKDADATAIYGSRGANGVILITTKKGKSGATRYTFSSSVGFSKVPKFMDMMNTQQYIQMREEAFKNSGVTTYPINAYDVNGTWDRNRYTNWQKELIGNTALSQNIALGVSGGNENTNFNLNLNHSENTTVFPTDKGYKRNSLLLSFNHRSSDDRLHITTSTNYSQQSNNLPTFDLTNQSLILAPNAPALYDKEGKLNWEGGTFENPLALLEETYENKVNTLILNTSLSYRLTSDLFLKINGGLTTNRFEEWRISPHTMNNPAYGLTSEASSSDKTDQNTYSYIIEPQIQYQKTFDKHRLDLLVGSTYQTTDANSSIIRGVGFSSDALIRNISAANHKYIGSTKTSQYKYLAAFTRLNYSFDNKYILNITARRDGSSRFAENNRFGNFGAVGGAWIFSQESFINNVSWLSFGKLRSSYGVTGSDNIGDYAYLDTYTVSSDLYNNETGLYPASLHNANYKWEKTTKFETALELGFLKDRINTSIAYYNNRSTDQLVGMTLPTTTGFTSILVNSPAVVENTGWEFTLSTNNISNAKWHWRTNFNISFPKNKLVAYPGLEEGTQSSFYIIGKPLNIVKTYEYKGLNPETGLFEFTDFNDDGKINALDKKKVNNLNPSFYGGIQNTISFKNFTLDFLFYFKKQNNYNINRMYVTGGAPIYNQPVEMLNRWSTDNPNAVYMQGVYNNAQADNLSDFFRDSDATISDASYIRLKNASLSYTLKIPKVNIESLRIYLQGQNLWTITSFKGMDPEFATFGYLPPLRTYSFGMQLIF